MKGLHLVGVSPLSLEATKDRHINTYQEFNKAIHSLEVEGSNFEGNFKLYDFLIL